MKTLLAALLLALCVAVPASAEDCAGEAPIPGGMIIFFPNCGTAVCPHGAPLQLRLEPAPFPVQPTPGFDAYWLQPCDEVTWNFGDGTTATVIGDGRVTHTWAEPGNYSISATVTNSLGSATYTSFNSSFVVSANPSQIEWPVLPAVSETAGSVSIPVRRTGSTAYRVSATLRVTPPEYWPEPAIAPASIPIVFEPGETEHIVTLPLRDNKLFDGTRSAAISIWDAAGGVTLKPGYLPITDDEVQPTITCASVSVAEGDGERTRVSIPCTLSAPLGTYLNLYGGLDDITATRYDDYVNNSRGSQIRAGDLSGVVELDLLGDTKPERDEQLTFHVGGYFNPWDPRTGPPATITIVNDDAAITPLRHRGRAGERVELTLYPGARFDETTEIPLRASDPSVLALPAKVTLPAGADLVTFHADLRAEGATRVEADLGTRSVAADVLVFDPRSIVASASTLTIPNGGTASVTLALSPPHPVPVAVQLTGDPDIIALPEQLAIPPGGSLTLQVRATALGETAIGVTSPADGVVGTAVMVNVVPARKRRAAR